jgi:hypothetical protein
VESATPTPTHLSGNSPPRSASAERLLKVRARTLQRKNRAVRPPAISMPVAGHMTQKITSLRTGGAWMRPK